MLGFGSAKFNQGTFGKGVQQGFVKSAVTSDAQVANYVIWGGYARSNSTVDVDVSGFRTAGAFLDIQNTSTVFSYPSGFIWDGKVDFGSGTSTMYAACKIAWDGQEVADTTWTTQIIE